MSTYALDYSPQAAPENRTVGCRPVAADQVIKWAIQRPSCSRGGGKTARLFESLSRDRILEAPTPTSRGIPMSNVTQILGQIEDGDGQAAEKLLPLVYDELRKLAAAKMVQEQPGQTLQATALVHEAYVRLVDTEKAQHWNSRGHFFSAAAEAMRRILVENARQKQAMKRGGDLQRVELADLPQIPSSLDLVALDEALNELAAGHPEKARLVTLRFFGGRSLDEAAEMIGVSRATAQRYWTYARAWLYGRLAPE